MRLIYSNIALFLYFLVLFHNTAPHRHDDQNSINQDPALISWFSKIFGQNHAHSLQNDTTFCIHQVNQDDFQSLFVDLGPSFPAQAILQFLAKPESFQKKLLEDWGLKNLPKTTSSLVLNPSFQQKQHKRGPPFVS